MLESELNALLADLTGHDADRALAAADKLKSEGTSGLSPRVKIVLDDAMARKDFFRRDLACELLLAFDGIAALPAALEAMFPDLGDDQDTLAFLVSEFISMNSSSAKPAVARYLLDPRPEARATAVWAVGFINDPESILHLQASLTDPEPQVRAQAMGALGSFTDVPDVTKLLLSGIEDPDADVRESAVSALGFSKNLEVAPPILKAMDDVEARVRRQAAFALGQLGFYEAVDRLRQAVVSDSDPYVRQEADAAVKLIHGIGRSSWGGTA
jgi:HEAT repeat protein